MAGISMPQKRHLYLFPQKDTYTLAKKEKAYSCEKRARMLLPQFVMYVQDTVLQQNGMHTQDETLEVGAVFPDVEGCPRLEVRAVLQLQLHCTWMDGHEARYRATNIL
jgi:hypothetical protein